VEDEYEKDFASNCKAAPCPVPSPPCGVVQLCQQALTDKNAHVSTCTHSLTHSLTHTQAHARTRTHALSHAHTGTRAHRAVHQGLPDEVVQPVHANGLSNVLQDAQPVRLVGGLGSCREGHADGGWEL